MKLYAAGALLACVMVTVQPGESWAFKAPESSPLPNFDSRLLAQQNGAPVSPRQQLALTKLRSALPGAAVTFDELTGAPRMVTGGSGFLTGPNSADKTTSAATLAAYASDPHGPTKTFLAEHRALFGFEPEALSSARVKRELVTAHNGLRTVVWEQQLNGIAVFNAVFTSHTTKRGELVSISSQFVPALETIAKTAARTPRITKNEAVAFAAQNLGETTRPEQLYATGTHVQVAADGQAQEFAGAGLLGTAQTRLVWLPMRPNDLRLCWEAILTSARRGEMYRVLLDAHTGETLVRQCLTAYLTDITLAVYTNASPAPLSPGPAIPNDLQPDPVPRTLVTFPALDTNASPAGWINDGANETLGNNVDAHTDLNNDDLPDLPRPQGSPARVFNFPLDLTQDPTNYSKAAVVQLFYWNNWMHDKLYELGFTEAAGNFQTDNFGRGGHGGDEVQADAQDSAALPGAASNRNNANFSTPPDGSPARMQIYVLNGAKPNRDGDLDAQIVLHEYTHGLSWRLVAGGDSLGDGAQADSMGEGWSDFYPLALLSNASDDPNGTFAAAAYASYMLGGPKDTQNYYFGIRRYPYTTDLARNPLTFKDIDAAQANYCSSAAPYHTARFGACSTGLAGEVHNAGEVWCVTLWDARANLIQEHGWATGNQLILQLVTDGMRLCPPQPNFLEARDAILRADIINCNGVNLEALWRAFAKRGLGFSATSPPHSPNGVHEAFDLPPDLRISPATGFVSSGPAGGPFDVISRSYSLINVGSNTLAWEVINSAPWLTVTPTNGTLAPGSPAAAVEIRLNEKSASLASNLYETTVFFTNPPNGVLQARPVVLRVGLPDSYTEVFDEHDNDLAFTSTTFTPDGSSSFYGACHDPAFSFPTDPSGGKVIPMSDDGFVQVTLSGAKVGLYGTRSNVFYIGGNGYLTLNAGDNTSLESLEAHFDRPRIAALFHDLDPASAGTVSWKQLPDRVAVTFQGVPVYGTSRPNDFQVEWFFDGRIRLTYLTLNCRAALVGLSRGQGMPSGFVETDLSRFAACVVLPVQTPQNFLTNASLAILAESCLPANHRADPGETITASFVFGNSGSTTLTNVTAMLLPTNGVAGPSGPVPCGDIPPGTVASAVFAFQAATICGADLNALLQVQHDARIENLAYAVPVGGVHQPLVANFDTVAPPALPTGWTASSVGTVPWHTAINSCDTPPNAAFASDPVTASDNQLVSPAFSVYSPSARLRFRHSYALESTCDGGRLDVSIDGGAFTDILAAGGEFVSGGYPCGSWWSGNSGGYITTLVNLPAAAAGHSLRLRWRLTTDASLGVTGWHVDSILVEEDLGCCFSDDVSIAGSSSSDPVNVGGTISYVLGVANSGPQPAVGVFVTNNLPPEARLVSASTTQGAWIHAGNIVLFDLGTLAPGGTAVLNITATAAGVGYLTNVATVVRDGVDPEPSNNTVVFINRACVPAVSSNFLAPGAITIPLLGAAAPYPSTNLVSGLTGNVSHLTVTVSNLTHSHPADVALLLVGPHSQNVVLMANAGGGFGLTNLNLTFDDAAGLQIPTNQITSGAYRPAGYAPPILPPPAPAPPYGTALSVFDGTDPNGLWKLYVYDDDPGDSGSIAQGWSLNISTTNVPLALPRMTVQQLSPNMIQFGFETSPGHIYYVEYTDSLADPIWLPLQTQPGDGTVGTASDRVTAGQRFYRVRVE